MRKGPFKDQLGVTLAEMMISAGLLSLLVLAVIPVFKMTRQGFASTEAQTAMTGGAQKAINRIQSNLIESKRIFENTTADLEYLDRILSQITTNASIPDPIAGSLLPTIEPNGSMAVSSTSFVQASVGNSLFFASVDIPEDMIVLSDNTVLNSTVPVRIDVYHFNYYYVSNDSTGGSIANKSKRGLWEWHSAKYADYEQIITIPAGDKRNNTVIALRNKGIEYAWMASQTDVDNAFYRLDSAGTLTAESSHNIIASTATTAVKSMLNLMRGITGGFQYSICPNTTGGAALTPAPRHTVPEFAAVSGEFPSGFEVVIVGPNGARQVFVRLVLVAKGGFKGLISKEQVVLASARDLW